MSTQEVREEALLNIRCIAKGYHLCRFEVNVREVFTADKKRGERRNVFKVVNQARTGTFELSKEDGTCGRGVEEKDESLVLLFTFKGLN